MKNAVVKFMATSVFSATFLLSSFPSNARVVPIHTSEASDAMAKTDVKKTRQKKKSASSSATPQQAKTVRFISGSEETKAERSTRLKRECKGQVNAGACQGYTR